MDWVLQEECARVLLFRGANKDVLNYANQDAFDLAIISGNTQLALMIKDFTPEEVGKRSYHSLLAIYGVAVLSAIHLLSRSYGELGFIEQQ